MSEEIKDVLESLRFKTSIYRDKKKRNLTFNDDEYYSNILIEYIEQLQQENQQLKEDYNCAFQDAEELNQRLKEVIDERNNLLSVLDEIREYIEKDYSFAKRGDIPLLTKDEQLAGKLFEILDKVGKE